MRTMSIWIGGMSTSIRSHDDRVPISYSWTFLNDCFVGFESIRESNKTLMNCSVISGAVW